jgi:hypothetical protein
MRAAVREIGAGMRPGDVVAGVGHDAILFSMDYYAARLLSPGTPVLLDADPPHGGGAARAPDDLGGDAAFIGA